MSRTSACVFAIDVEAEGAPELVARLRERADVDGVTIAANYHHARDVLPHNRLSTLYFHEGGVQYFRSSTRDFEGVRIKPQQSKLVGPDSDPVRELWLACDRAGVELRTWTNTLHNSRLGTLYPEATVENAFGDRVLHYLCPANPDAEAYAIASARSLARVMPGTLLLESLNYQTFDHGYHHERSFVVLSPLTKLLLGLCFCDHCRQAMSDCGDIDADRLRELVSARIRATLERGGDEEHDCDLRREDIEALFGGAMEGAIRAREGVVTGLVGRVAEAACEAGAKAVRFMDQSGGVLGYGSEPHGPPAPARSWQDGVDLGAIGSQLGGVVALGYARDPQRVATDLEAYRAELGADVPLSVAIRPMHPDCGSASELLAKLTAIKPHRPEWVEYYHYGLMPMGNLDWLDCPDQ